jgi:hypothetical protein
VKLITSLISAICMLTVLIMSHELIQGSVLSTRKLRLVARVANMGERCVQVLVVKPEGKITLKT